MMSASLDQITIEQPSSLQTKRTGAPEASVGHVSRRCLVDYPEALNAVVDGHVSSRVAASVDSTRSNKPSSGRCDMTSPDAQEEVLNMFAMMRVF